MNGYGRALSRVTLNSCCLVTAAPRDIALVLCKSMAILAIVAVTLAWPKESIAAATPLAAGVKPILLVDGLTASLELAGIDSLEWRAGSNSLAPLLLDVELADGPLFRWLQESLAKGNGTKSTRTLDLVVTESGKVLDAWRLTGARIVQVAFDDFNGNNKVKWHYKLTIQAISAAPLPAANSRSAKDPTIPLKPILQSNFKVSIGGLSPRTTGRIAAVTGLTVKLDGGSPFVTAVVTSSMVEYGAYSDWRANVMRGASADPAASGAQDMVISILGTDLKVELANITFPKVALQRLTLPLGTASLVTKFEIGLTAESLVLALNTAPAVVAAVPKAPPPAVIVLDHTLRDIVPLGQSSVYSASVTTGQTYVVSLSGIVGAAQLKVFNDAALTQPTACIAPDNLSNSLYRQPADCTFVATGGTVYATVTGTSYLATANNSYNIRVSPYFDAPAAIQGTETSPVEIPVNKPFGGTSGPVGTDSSYYMINTTGRAGDVVISMTGLTGWTGGSKGDATIALSIFDNPKFNAPKLDNVSCNTPDFRTFAESCILPAGNIYYLRVTTGRAGGSFTLMVDSPPGTVAPPAAAAPTTTNVMQQALPASSMAP